jgi:hypothetical protein
MERHLHSGKCLHFFVLGRNTMFLLQWFAVTASPSWPGSSGSLRFRLLNGRHPFVFRYFRGDDLLAESNEVQPLGATPLQVCASRECCRARFSDAVRRATCL